MSVSSEGSVIEGSLDFSMESDLDSNSRPLEKTLCENMGIIFSLVDSFPLNLRIVFTSKAGFLWGREVPPNLDFYYESTSYGLKMVNSLGSVFWTVSRKFLVGLLMILFCSG